jgi:hypothetical protein
MDTIDVRFGLVELYQYGREDVMRSHALGELQPLSGLSIARDRWQGDWRVRVIVYLGLLMDAFYALHLLSLCAVLAAIGLSDRSGDQLAILCLEQDSGMVALTVLHHVSNTLLAVFVRHYKFRPVDVLFNAKCGTAVLVCLFCATGFLFAGYPGRCAGTLLTQILLIFPIVTIASFLTFLALSVIIAHYPIPIPLADAYPPPL